MKPGRFIFAWSFVFLVTVFDAIFAWNYRVGFEEWELNPFALWIFQTAGMAMVLGVKALLMLFACAVAIFCHRRRHRLEVPLTVAVSGFYLLLSMHYVAGYASGDIGTADATEPVLAARP